MSAETFLNGKVTMLLGDVRAMLKTLPDDHFDCVVTSPPYWGLRDYGVAGQIGLEPTLGEHLEVMVSVFEEVRRVLKRSGTFWLNYGDCYATAPNGRSAADTKAAGNDDRTFRDKPFSTIGPINRSKRAERGSGRWGNGNNSDATLKAKDLCMIPNRLAISLQEAGWWVRSEIIWAKPNPMPESIKDRPATSHEKIFLLSKSGRYFYDAPAVRQDAAESSIGRWAQNVEGQEGSARANGGAKTNGTMKAVGGPRTKQDATAASAGAVGSSSGRRMAGFNARWDAKEKVRASELAPRHAGHISHTGIEDTPRGEGRSLRNYERAPLDAWVIGTSPFSEAHFATFPPELAARCIKAGCPEGGIVLDPFGGAGTTAMVAVSLGRSATMIELNPEYATLARARIEAAFMGRDEGARHMVKQLGKTPKAFEPGSLFAGIEAAE